MEARPLWQMTRELVQVARGDRAPELVLTNAQALCVYTGKIRERQELWITGGRIAKVCESGTFLKTFPNVPKPQTEVFDCGSRLLAPGLVDPHIHVESSRVTVAHYAEAALLNGTTTIIADNHEIANVCDTQGIDWMAEDGLRSPLNVYWTVPSTVPATSADFETAGGDLTPQKINYLLNSHSSKIIALGEKMDYPQVVAGDQRSHSVMAEAHKRGLPVCGHVYGLENVAAYAASGITDTHEAIDAQIAKAMLEAGMWVFIRGGPPGTAWDSLPQAIKAVTEAGCATHRVCLCTDDRNPADLLRYGLDYVVRRAVEAGVPLTRAWQMASLNPALRYGLDGELGGLGHGRRADIVLLDDKFLPQNVWLAGELVISDRMPTPFLKQALVNVYQYPEKAFRTVKLPQRWQVFPEPPEKDSRANVIAIVPPGIVTRHLTQDIKAGAAISQFCRMNELAVLTVIERHGRNGNIAHGFVKGLGLKNAAVASTVSHDAHNLLAAGDNVRDMEEAIAVLQEHQGGISVVSNGRLKAFVPLPIAGLMSFEPVEIVAEQSRVLQAAWQEVGFVIGDMEFTLLSLSVIPELRLTDKGLVKVPEMTILPLFE